MLFGCVPFKYVYMSKFQFRDIFSYFPIIIINFRTVELEKSMAYYKIYMLRYLYYSQCRR